MPDVFLAQHIILILMLQWSCLDKVFPRFSYLYSCMFIKFYLHLFSFPQHYPGIIELNVEPYLEDEGTGDLRYVQVYNL